MTDLLTAAQMRAIEEAAISSGEVTGLALMERAGRGVVAAIFEEWPELLAAPHRAVVLCGPGNNGGDGFVVARLLTDWGWAVEVFLYGDAGKLPPDAKANYERWRELGEVRPFPEQRPEPGSADLVLDAGFGTGLARPIHEDLMTAFLDAMPKAGERTGGKRAFVVAVDIPTGLSSDTGEVMPAAVRADLTVTFHAAKLGHYLGRGAEFSGKIRVKSIGLEGRARAADGGDTLPSPRGADRERSPEGVVSLATPEHFRLGKSVADHKYGHGHAFVLSGGLGKTGAARMAARGALRIGAGLVTIGCPHQALAEVAAQVTAIMCKPLDGAPGLHEVLEDKRLNTLCLGPGMGLGLDTQAMVLEALKAERATVLDADALTRFERNPGVLFDALHARCVLTPHEGEFGRLFPDIKEKFDAPATGGPAFSKVDATREAAKRAGCVVLFKGPDTVIAAPDGRCAINASMYERAAPWLATAGSGDVLAGFVTGLLSRGFSPFDAAKTGVWLHTECALSFGPGLIAEDLPEELPKVFRKLEPAG